MRRHRINQYEYKDTHSPIFKCSRRLRTVTLSSTTNVARLRNLRHAVNNQPKLSTARYKHTADLRIHDGLCDTLPVAIGDEYVLHDERPATEYEENEREVTRQRGRDTREWRRVWHREVSCSTVVWHESTGGKGSEWRCGETKEETRYVESDRSGYTVSYHVATKGCLLLRSGTALLTDLGRI